MKIDNRVLGGGLALLLGFIGLLVGGDPSGVPLIDNLAQTTTVTRQQTVTASSNDIVSQRVWHCDSQVGTPAAPLHVVVDISSPPAPGAVELDKGCTGALFLDIKTNVADGIKVHDGAHDLTVSGIVECTGRTAGSHQDGVQAQGGERVTFEGLRVNCPSGNNGAFYVTKKHAAPGDHVPTDIVCDHCDLQNNNAAVNIGSHSIRSGVRNSVLHLARDGSGPRDCRRISQSATAPIDEQNTCAP